MSSSTTSARDDASAPTDSSNAVAPLTAQRGTIADTVTKPLERIRKSRRVNAMVCSFSPGPSGELEGRTGQHDVDESAHLLVHVRRVVRPGPARAVVVRLQVGDPGGAHVAGGVLD